MKLKTLLYISAFLLVVISCEKKDNNEETTLEPITIDFSSFNVTEKNTTFSQGNISMIVTETLAEDCAEGYCAFEFTSTGLILMPARVEINLQSVTGISSITIAGYDNCAQNCTKVFFYDADGNVVNSGSVDQGFGEYSISFNSGLGNAKSMAVSTCEGSVDLITIE